MKEYRVAILGATGAVGREMMRVLEERQFPLSELRLLASARSAGSRLPFRGEELVLEQATPQSFAGCDIVLGAAENDVATELLPHAVAQGAVVIDNSSAYRLDPEVPLVVPEVNPQDISWHKGLISNPNCTTIITATAVAAIHRLSPIVKMTASTYQAVSGAGLQGYLDLENGLRGEAPKKFPHPIAGNCLPHIDVFLDNGYTKEEQKMIDETRKILSLPELPVTATTVRVPVFHGHSESINVEFERPFELDALRALLEKAPGLVVMDDPARELYPMAITAADTDPVYVGRIRRDFSVQNGINFWCVADNIRKGAATNAVQIAEELIRQWEA